MCKEDSPLDNGSNLLDYSGKMEESRFGFEQVRSIRLKLEQFEEPCVNRCFYFKDLIIRSVIILPLTLDFIFVEDILDMF